MTDSKPEAFDNMNARLSKILREFDGLTVHEARTLLANIPHAIRRKGTLSMDTTGSPSFTDDIHYSGGL